MRKITDPIPAELFKKYMKDWYGKDRESPYGMLGAHLFGCIYCGARHSDDIECRLPCSHPGCTRRGIPWQVKGSATAALCMRHKPEGGEPLPVPPPQSPK